MRPHALDWRNNARRAKIAADGTPTPLANGIIISVNHAFPRARFMSGIYPCFIERD